MSKDDFVEMEPIIIYPTNGGNGLYIEPVRNRTEWIGRLEGKAAYNLEETRKFLEMHFKKLGGNKAT